MAFIVRVTNSITFTTSKTVINIRQGVSVFNIDILKITATMNKKVVESVILKVVPPTMFAGPMCTLISILTSYVIFFVFCFGERLLRKREHRACSGVVLTVSSIKLKVFAMMKMGAKVHRKCVSGIFLLMFLKAVAKMNNNLLESVVTDMPPCVFMGRVCTYTSVVNTIMYMCVGQFIKGMRTVMMSSVMIILVQCLTTRCH